MPDGAGADVRVIAVAFPLHVEDTGADQPVLQFRAFHRPIAGHGVALADGIGIRWSYEATAEDCAQCGAPARQSGKLPFKPQRQIHRGADGTEIRGLKSGRLDW